MHETQTYEFGFLFLYMKTINNFIQEAFINKQNIGSVRDTNGRLVPPQIDYKKVNSDDLRELQKFLKDNGLWPTKKIKDKYDKEGGKWIMMIKAIDDWEDGYVLAYETYDIFDSYADDYLIFKEDGVVPGSRYGNILQQKDVMDELDQIINVFGKSDEWVDGNDR